jgi:uncharacterized glyoxalase superfamily protein PhnB
VYTNGRFDEVMIDDERWRGPVQRFDSRVRATRPGFRSVTPRIVVDDPAAQVAFLRKVFDAVGDCPAGRPAEIRIGDALILVSSIDVRSASPAFLYVYVEDADAAYQRALGEGAISLEAPLDTPYGDRRAMVRDPFGNIWQIAHVLGHRR